MLQFFRDVGNVFKLVIFFKYFLFCYGLFRFLKCWKLFSESLAGPCVIYTVIWAIFAGAQSFRKQLTFQVLLRAKSLKTPQASIFPTRNWLDRLLVHFFVLLSAPGAEHRQVLLIWEKEKKRWIISFRFIELVTCILIRLRDSPKYIYIYI